MELTFVALDSGHFLIERIGNVYYESGLVHTILDHVIDALRTPGRLGLAIVFCLYFAEPGEEAGVGNELTGAAVVGVAVGKGIGYNDFWLVFADVDNELFLVLLVVTEEAIGHISVFSYYKSHNLCCILRLFVAEFGCTAGAELAHCKVYYAYLLAFFGMLDEGTGYSEFYIIGMDGYGKDV